MAFFPQARSGPQVKSCASATAYRSTLSASRIVFLRGQMTQSNLSMSVKVACVGDTGTKKGPTPSMMDWLPQSIPRLSLPLGAFNRQQPYSACCVIRLASCGATRWDGGPSVSSQNLSNWTPSHSANLCMNSSAVPSRHLSRRRVSPVRAKRKSQRPLRKQRRWSCHLGPCSVPFPRQFYGCTQWQKPRGEHPEGSVPTIRHPPAPEVGVKYPLARTGADPSTWPWDATVTIPIPEAGLVYGGRMDRVDIRASGDVAQITDYKSVKPPPKRRRIALGQGRELQRVLYATAVRALLPEVGTVVARLIYLADDPATFELSGEELDRAIADATRYLVAAVGILHSGRIAPRREEDVDYDDMRLALPADRESYLRRKADPFKIANRALTKLWDASS